MKKFIITAFITIMIKPCLLFSDPLHTREMMMQVVTSGGSPVARTVKLYKNFGYYFELYRTGISESYWRWTAPDANVACDIGDNNTNNPTWEPIVTGNYLLWCDNKFATLYINEIPTGGDGDFSIKFQNGTFTIIFNNRGVTLGSTQDWNKVVATFGQKKSDGSTNVGTVSIGLGSSFSQRYSAPNEFYTNRNETYLFDADPDIYNAEKYHHYQNITDVRNFREQYIGTQNYITTSVFNPTQPGIVISNFFPESPSLNPDDDEIQFKDPWLMDYNDPQHGNKKRNRGTYGEVFQPLPSPFYPDFSNYYNGNVYKGVFLNQPYSGNNPVYYSVKAVSPQPISISGRVHYGYFQSWTYDPNKISLQYPSSNETPVVFKTSDASLTTNLKVSQISNDQNAYANPNQRRFIRTTDTQYNTTYFHMVYESMGKIWYERSTNNGQTWEIMNGGKPINDGFGKFPSIDSYPSNHNVIIVYNKNESEIAAQYYENGVLKCESIVSNSGWVTGESKPVIAWTYSRLMVAWNEIGYILYRLGQKVTNSNPPLHDFYWYFDPRVISDPLETDKDNPTIGTSKQQLISFWLAWDRNESAIQFVNLNLIDDDEDIQQSAIYTYGLAGFTMNYQPSISVTPSNDYRISWFGRNEIDGIVTKKVITYFNNQFYIFGNSPVSSHSMSVTDDGKAIIAYGDQDGTRNKFRQVWYWGSEKNLGTTGKQTHLSNGTSINNMYAMSFQNSTLPYSFSMSASLGSLQKVTEIPIASGRKGIVAGDSAEFYFTLGDVTLNGNTIDFIPTGINPDFSKLDTLNYYLSTEKFNVTNSSQFNFSIEYGVTDSLKAVQSLVENEYVKFKLQLINANTNQVMGEYTVVTFTKQNIIPYYGESFSINTSGIGNKKVRVRIVAEENIGGEYAMANISAEQNVLPKQNENVISYSGSEVVTEYAVEQNYPNPFNPTTTIKYQIPTSGNVTIKVYDILGNEVANLVDGYMETGKYEVEFNASKLTSGVYIYRLNVNDFTNVKKMVLLK